MKPETYEYCPICSCALKLGIYEGAEKAECSSISCHFVHWNNPIPVVLALVELEGRFVVTHNVEWPSWKYSLVSGFLDARESPEEAVVREVGEELGLRVVGLSIITASTHQKLNQLMISYHVKTDGSISLNHENDDYKLLSEAELADWEFGAGAKPTIDAWLASRRP